MWTAIKNKIYSFLKPTDVCQTETEPDLSVIDKAIIGREPADRLNGLVFDGQFLPQVIAQILLQVDAGDLLRCSEVCVNWYRLIRSDRFWKLKFEQETGRAGKNLPWWLYYSYLTTDYWNRLVVLDPTGVKALPDVPEQIHAITCYNYLYGSKKFRFERNPLFCKIMHEFNPHVYYNFLCLSYVSNGRLYARLKSYVLNHAAGDAELDDLDDGAKKQLTRAFNSAWKRTEFYKFRGFYRGAKYIREIIEYGASDWNVSFVDNLWKIDPKHPMTGMVCKVDLDSIIRPIPLWAQRSAARFDAAIATERSWYVTNPFLAIINSSDEE